MSDTKPSIKLVEATAPQLLDLGAAADRWPGVFSCNSAGRVWAFETWSWTPEVRRTYLEGKLPLLDLIVKKVLRIRPEGGRFRVSEVGVRMVRDGAEVLRFTDIPWRAQEG
jgi:hypothetical protein